MKKISLILTLFLFSGCAHKPMTQPVIDVHRHGTWPESDDAPYRDAVLAEKKENNVALSLLSITEKDDLGNWHDAAPGRFMTGIMVPCPRNLSEPYYKCFPKTEGWADLDWLRTEIETGRISLIHEMTLNYYGLRPDDERLAPYWALAAEFDLPVGIHTGRGPGPGAKNSTRSQPGCCPNYDKEMGNPELLRPILERHPDLRIWIQHVGSGRGEYTYHWDEALALLADYPNVNVDVSITNGVMSEQVYADALKRLIKAGFGDRIMYGSDNLPAAPILDRLSRMEFLSESQRRGILYDNAAKFLRLDTKTLRAHERAVQ
jgi:hypothetical protein